MNNIPKAIEASEAKLKELQACDNEAWRVLKAAEETLEPLKKAWSAAYEAVKTESNRLAALKTLLAEEEAQPKLFEAA